MAKSKSKRGRPSSGLDEVQQPHTKDASGIVRLSGPLRDGACLPPDARPSGKVGRPDTGLTEAKVLVTGPELLLGAAKLAAIAEGVSEREWWRRAARVRLGWHEVVPPPKTGSGEARWYEVVPDLTDDE